MSETSTQSRGAKYYPVAFKPEMLELGRKVANDPNFNQLLVRYVLAFMTEPSQFVHFRAELIHAVQRHVKHSLVAVTWAAMSLSSDRYFAEKGKAYGWELEEENDIASRWFDLIAAAFLPSTEVRKVDLSTLRKWITDFRALQTRDVGPMSGCEMCTSKCMFNYDVSKILTEELRNTFEALLAISDVPTAVGYLRLQTIRLILNHEVDLTYCTALHIVARKSLSDEAQDLFMAEVRLSCEEKHEEQVGISKQTDEERDDWLDIICKTAMARAQWREIYALQMQEYNISSSEIEKRLDEQAVLSSKPVRDQVFEVIVKQALAGGPWRRMCAAAMDFLSISADEIELEVNKRKKTLPS